LSPHSCSARDQPALEIPRRVMDAHVAVGQHGWRRGRTRAGTGGGGDLAQDACRQLARMHPGAVFQQADALHQVYEFAHAAGPLAGEEDRLDLGIEPLARAAAQRVVLAQETVGQQENVVAAVAQRRDVDRDRLQPVVQVVAELARLDLLQQDLVGGGDEAHVDVDRADRADAPEALAVERREDLGLHQRVESAHLVEEHRTTVGGLDQPLLLAHGAGEGAALMAEQFRLPQLGWDGGAVDVDERVRGALRQLVDRARHQALAGAGLAVDQHRAGLARRDPFDHVAQRHDPRVFADQLVYGGGRCSSFTPRAAAPSAFGRQCGAHRCTSSGAMR
jgi:hypothetical protein